MRIKGFTLIEIMIAVSLISLISAISITTFRLLTDQQSLDRDVESALSVVLRARHQTISGEKNTQYGVHFASTSVTLFQGSTYDANAPTNVRTQFNNRTYMHSIQLSTNNPWVVFNPLTGAPNATGTIRYRSQNGQSQEQVIHIYASGLVEVQ